MARILINYFEDKGEILLPNGEHTEVGTALEEVCNNLEEAMES